MIYRDEKLTCAECGREFYWTVEEQREAERTGRPAEAPQYCRVHRPRAEEPEEAEEAEEQPRPRAPGRVAPPDPSAPYGRVKWFSAEKGYGFLIEPNGDELFFHVSGLAPGVEPHFADGAPVTYDIQYGIKGAQAVNVAPYEG